MWVTVSFLIRIKSNYWEVWGSFKLPTREHSQRLGFQSHWTDLVCHAQKTINKRVQLGFISDEFCHYCWYTKAQYFPKRTVKWSKFTNTNHHLLYLLFVVGHSTVSKLWNITSIPWIFGAIYSRCMIQKFGQLSRKIWWTAVLICFNKFLWSISFFQHCIQVLWTQIQPLFI